MHRSDNVAISSPWTGVCFAVGALGFAVEIVASHAPCARISSRLRTVPPNLVNGAVVPDRVLEF